MTKRNAEAQETVPKWHSDFQSEVMGEFGHLNAKTDDLLRRATEQNGAVVKLWQKSNEAEQFSREHPLKCGIRDELIQLRDEVRAGRNEGKVERREARVELDTVKNTAEVERGRISDADKSDQRLRAAVAEERAKWFHRISHIPNLLYVVIMLAAMIFYGHSREWLEAIGAIGKAVSPK